MMTLSGLARGFYYNKMMTKLKTRRKKTTP